MPIDFPTVAMVAIIGIIIITVLGIIIITKNKK